MNLLPGSATRALVLIPAVVLSVAAMAEPPGGRRTPLEAEELRDAASRAYQSVLEGVRIGSKSPSELCPWSRRWMEAERAMSETREGNLQAVRRHLARLKGVAEESPCRPSDVHTVSYYLTEAEALLASMDPKQRELNRRIVEDRRQLQGEWKTRSETVSGKPVKDPDFCVITVEGRLVRETSGIGRSWGFLSLDPTTLPRTFKYVGVNEDYQPSRTGAYRLADDVLTVTLPGDRVLTLVRVKGKPEKAAR
jgi:uncharacterized protein (TIGR03067 family)